MTSWLPVPRIGHPSLISESVAAPSDRTPLISWNLGRGGGKGGVGEEFEGHSIPRRGLVLKLLTDQSAKSTRFALA